MEQEIDIIKLLLKRDLTLLCFDIFCHLDTNSIVSCRLVCHNWRNFIDHNFFNLPKGQKWIKNKLASNILDENYEPQTKQITTSSEDNFKFFAVVADEESVCVSTFCGSIFSYKFLTLEHMWTLKLGNDSVQHCMNQQRVFVVSFAKNDAPGGHLFIIDRFNGEMLNKIENIHAHGIQGVSIYENSILATADKIGVIKFHRVNDDINEPNTVIKIFEEETYQVRGFTHLDSHGDKLISGSSSGEVIAWDFQTGAHLHSIQSDIQIMSLRVKWPIVVICTFSFTDDDKKKGIKLFDIEKECLIRHITCGYATDVFISGNILMVSGNFWDLEDDWDIAHRFWNLDQLVKNSVKIEDVKKRKLMTTTATHYICSIVGSVVFTTEGKFLIQRSFWP